MRVPYPIVFSPECNKQNIFSYILCKVQFFLLWKKEKPPLKKNSQFNITDISKNLLQAFEIQEEQQSLYCFESGRGEN